MHDGHHYKSISSNRQDRHNDINEPGKSKVFCNFSLLQGVKVIHALHCVLYFNAKNAMVCIFLIQFLKLTPNKMTIQIS